MNNPNLNLVVNYTPHPVVVYMEDGSVVAIPSSGSIRLEEEKSFVPLEVAVQDALGEYHVVPVFEKKLGRIIGAPLELPAQTRIIVSLPVAGALQKYYKQMGKDYIILVPGDTIRDKDGKVIGIKNFHILTED